VDSNHSRRAARKLDCVQFASMADDDAFGFIDPMMCSEALTYYCFCERQIHADGKGLSRCARDSSTGYNIMSIGEQLIDSHCTTHPELTSSFVDRDMMMRYIMAWGLGILTHFVSVNRLLTTHMVISNARR